MVEALSSLGWRPDLDACLSPMLDDPDLLVVNEAARRLRWADDPELRKKARTLGRELGVR